MPVSSCWTVDLISSTRRGYQTCKTCIKKIKSGFKCGGFHILLKVLYFVTTRKYPLVEKQRLQVAIIYLRYSRACSIHGCILPLTRKLTLNFHACLHILLSLLPLREWETARRHSSLNNSWPFDEGKNMVTWEFIKRSFLRQFKGDCWQNTFTGLTIKRALIFHCYNVFSHTSTSRFRSPLTTDPPPPAPCTYCLSLSNTHSPYLQLLLV